MKHQDTLEQMSLFDIELPPIQEAAEIVAHADVPPEAPQVSAKASNSCALVPDEEFLPWPGTPKNIPSVNGILKLLEKGLYKVNSHAFLSDVFECGAIAISNRFDFRQAEQREERYLQIINGYDKDMQELLVSVFAEISALLQQQINPAVGFGDYLGELYMRSETSNKHAGQFFTPYNLSKCCAQITINSQIVEDAIENDKILTLHEPACGSSGMIIAAADVLYNQYHFNISRNFYVECSDIDSRCVHMSFLQLGLAGIPAVIFKRDALSMQTWERWETPAYIMQYSRFVNA